MENKSMITTDIMVFLEYVKSERKNLISAKLSSLGQEIYNSRELLSRTLMNKKKDVLIQIREILRKEVL